MQLDRPAGRRGLDLSFCCMTCLLPPPMKRAWHWSSLFRNSGQPPCLSKPEEHRTPPYGSHACANSSTKPTVSSSRARMLSGQAERLLVPAPLPRRGDRAFSRRTMAGPTHPHASGSRNGHLHGVAEPTPLATAAELNSLRREVEELRQLLWAHQQGAHACPTPNTTRQIEPGMPDRREEGMFDSRFHSTSSCVGLAGGWCDPGQGCRSGRLMPCSCGVSKSMLWGMLGEPPSRVSDWNWPASTGTVGTSVLRCMVRRCAGLHPLLPPHHQLPPPLVP